MVLVFQVNERKPEKGNESPKARGFLIALFLTNEQRDVSLLWKEEVCSYLLKCLSKEERDALERTGDQAH